MRFIYPKAARGMEAGRDHFFQAVGTSAIVAMEMSMMVVMRMFVAFAGA